MTPIIMPDDHDREIVREGEQAYFENRPNPHPFGTREYNLFESGRHLAARRTSDAYRTAERQRKQKDDEK